MAGLSVASAIENVLRSTGNAQSARSTVHAHTIRLPSCTVSLGPCAKFLVQETKAYTLLKVWDCILDRHNAMVSVFRVLVFCGSLRRICTQTLLCATCQNIGTGFLCMLCSSKPSLVSRLEFHQAYNMLVCTSSSGGRKENSTHEIQLLNHGPEFKI